MKRLLVPVVIAVSIVSCTKKDLTDNQTPSNYIIRVAAVEANGSKTYTTIAKVNAGRVAVEFETAEVSNIEKFNIEVSSDGSNFREVRAIAADLSNPNKVYKDTLYLK